MKKSKNVLSSTNFWLINKSVHLALGGDVALLLSDLSYRQDYWETRNKLTEDGFFFIERSILKKDTLLSETKQWKASKVLIDLGVLEVKRRGIPPKNYYRIDNQKVNDLVVILSQK